VVCAAGVGGLPLIVVPIPGVGGRVGLTCSAGVGGLCLRVIPDVVGVGRINLVTVAAVREGVGRCSCRGGVCGVGGRVLTVIVRDGKVGVGRKELRDVVRPGFVGVKRTSQQHNQPLTQRVHGPRPE